MFNNSSISKHKNKRQAERHFVGDFKLAFYFRTSETTDVNAAAQETKGNSTCLSLSTSTSSSQPDHDNYND